jgi:hypothetical protein
MSAAQQKAQANFKKAIAYRGKTGCSLKEAFAHVKGNKVTGVKKAAVKKKAAIKSTHKDTKSHNVNIKVVSGISAGAKKLWLSINKRNLFKYNSEENVLNFLYQEALKKKQYKKATLLKELMEDTNMISGWKKGTTYFREKEEGKVKAAKNIKVSRVPKGSLYKAGTFSKFSKLAGLFDTTVIKDLDQLKKQYFTLVKIYHPDAGGTHEQFIKLKDEYDKLRDAILKGSNLSEEEKKNEVVIDEALQTIIDNIINIEDINIELIGKWIWVSPKLTGFTNSSYALLKQAGLTYAKKAGKPYMLYKGVESKGSRGKMSKEEIEKKYGKTKFEPKKGNKLNGIIKNKAKILAAFNRLKKGMDKRPV